MTSVLNRASLVAQRLKCLPAMWETWVRSLGQEDPLEEEMATNPVFMPGKSHGPRSLVGYSPWGHKESDTTEQLSYALLCSRNEHSIANQLYFSIILKISFLSLKIQTFATHITKEPCKSNKEFLQTNQFLKQTILSFIWNLKNKTNEQT